MRKLRFVFRVDGGNVYGVAMGHVYRCLKAADYFSNKGHDIIFFMKNFPKGIEKVDNKYSVEIMPTYISLNSERKFILDKIDQNDVYMCDTRGIDNAYIESFKDKVSLFCYFDDIGVKELHPDIIVNPSPFADYCLYEKINTCQYLLGLEYFILDTRIYQKKKDKFPTKIEKLLFSFGGADPQDITYKLMQSLPDSFKNYDIAIVIGCAYDNEKERCLREIVSLLTDSGFKINICKDVDSLYPLLLEADVACVAGGDTCIESIFTGTPPLIIASINYEQKTALYLQKKQVALSVGFIENDDIKTIIANIEKAINDRNIILKLFSTGKDLVDGKGLQRLGEVINSKLS